MKCVGTIDIWYKNKGERKNRWFKNIALLWWRNFLILLLFLLPFAIMVSSKLAFRFLARALGHWID